MKVFLTESIHADAVAMLKEHGEVVQGTSFAEEDIIRQAQGCDAILIRVAKITAAVMDGVTGLRAVAKHGIGVDNIDVRAATERGIQVLNAPLSNINAVAEHALAMILSIAKNLSLLDGETRKSGFSRRNEFVNIELSGKIVGLVGFGKIAQGLAKKLSCMDVQIIASDPYADREAAVRRGVRLVEQDELLRTADFVSLHTPLLDSTHKLINRETLAMMKPTAYLINVARGPIVDEQALYDALKKHTIAGAALDVFDPEPPKPECPLFALDNVLLSPHNAALTDRALLAMAMDSAMGIVDYLDGREPCFPVNTLAQHAIKEP